MAKIEPIKITVSLEQCRPFLEMLYGRIEELVKENENLKQIIDDYEQAITENEGLSLHQ